MGAYDWHKPLERKGLLFTVYTGIAVLIGGLVLLVPPFFLQGTVEPVEGLEPYTALEQEGRDLYIREGCNVCHSQQVRPFKVETARYGPYSLAGEGVYDRPFLWGSRRTGPDLARVGGKYPDSWHWLHFEDPRNIEPRSNMPGFAFLQQEPLDLSETSEKLAALRSLGHPYTEAEVANAAADAREQMAAVAERLRADGIELTEVEAHSEAVALIAYLQKLGTAVEEVPMETARAEGPDGER